VAARRLLAALRRQGTEAHLLVRERTGPAQDGLVPLAFTPGERRLALARFTAERAVWWLHERDASVRWAFSPAPFGADLARHPLVRQAEVLHLHWTNFGFLSLKGLQNLLRLGKPVVWTLHDQWAFTGGCHYSRGCERFKTHCRQCPFLRRPGDRDLSARIFEKKRKVLENVPLTVVACSDWLAGEARQSALLGGFPIQSIPNPIDTTVWQPTDRAVARQMLGLPLDKKLVLFGAGNLRDARKGFRFLVEAMGGLNDAELVVFGKNDPDPLARLPFAVHNLGVIANENHLIAAYNAADALAVPSLEDNLPNTIVEALACGTPVVAFATGGIPEMMVPEKTGWLAPPRDALALAEGLRWALFTEHPEIQREAARAFAVKNYAEGAVAAQYLDLYHRLKP
jgi:glycosyltransferase involved in cell wall biosynthesis